MDLLYLVASVWIVVQIMMFVFIVRKSDLIGRYSFAPFVLLDLYMGCYS